MHMCGITDELLTGIPEGCNKSSHEEFLLDDLTRLADTLLSECTAENDSPCCSPTLTVINKPKLFSTDIPIVPKTYTIQKPIESYLQMIATTIMESTDQRLILAEIYENMNKNWPKFSLDESTWKNSVRHSLSTNTCFRKNGRAPSGRGYYWSIHPACISMFTKGDFRRGETKRRVQLMQQKMNKQQCKAISTSSQEYLHDKLIAEPTSTNEQFSNSNKNTIGLTSNQHIHNLYPQQFHRTHTTNQHYLVNPDCSYANSTTNQGYARSHRPACSSLSSDQRDLSYLYQPYDIQSTMSSNNRSLGHVASRSRHHPYRQPSDQVAQHPSAYNMTPYSHQLMNGYYL